MNKLWIWLSIACTGVVFETFIVTASIFAVLDWQDDKRITVDDYLYRHEYVVEPLVEKYIVEGKSDEAIVELLESQQQLESLLKEKRANGFSPGMSGEEHSLASALLRFYLYDLVNPDTLLVIVVGSALGMLTSIIMSRQLTRPLANLTKASKALAQQDLTKRVEIKGSDEINELATTFNDMASQLAHAEQVRKKMLSDVSHELRTPLAGLEGTLRATLDGVFTLDKHHISNLYNQTHHLTHLVEDLFLLTRIDAQRFTLNKTTLDLTMLLQKLVEVFVVLARDAGITFMTDLRPVEPIYADAIRIRQIISNLLTNALHHTPSDGRITLALTQVGHRVEICVSDTGVGIAEDKISHLFERFYRVEHSRSRETGGSGLGLAISKALVEAHDGQILVASQGMGKGSTFTITFPSLYDLRNEKLRIE